MPLRDRPRVSYTTPPSFLAMEANYQRERRARGGAGAAKNKRHRSHRRDSGHGRSPDSDEEDQLASSSEDDGDSVGSGTSLLSRADELDRAVLQQAKAKKRSKKREVQAAKVGGGGGGGGRRDKAHKYDPLKRLPKEVLMNILAHLSFGTLHAVSQLSSYYRNMTMLDEVDAIWAAAREAEGLPDLEEGSWGWFEPGYASLVHGKHCNLCGKRSPRWPDVFLRMRLCKPCRSENIVRLDHLDQTDSDLHGAVKDCVIQSRQAPDDPHQLRKKLLHGDLAALESESDTLWRLQDKDDADDEEFYADKFAAAWAKAGSRAAVGHKGGGQGKYDEAPRRKEGEWGRRVTAYVKKRRAACARVEKEGEALFKALEKLYAREATEGEDEADGSSTARREAFEERVLALSDKEEWTKDDFYGPWLSDKLVNRGLDTVNDDEWDALKPKVLKVLAASRKKRIAAVEAAAQAQRREDLLPVYQALRARQPSAEAMVWTPLFVDFLLFPSVRALWQPHGAIIAQHAIDSAKEDIDEDLDEWRTSLRLHVIQLVLSNTLDLPEDEELDSDADAYEDYGDEFLRLLTSSVMCAVDDCRHAAIGRKGAHDYVPSRPTFFGPLLDVLHHQHEAHDYLRPSKHELVHAATPAAVDGEPHFRVALPLEVSSAVVAMCDAAGLDDEVVEPEDLDEVLEGEAGWVQWSNMPGGGHGRKEKDWRSVLCSIYRAAVKAQHARPPRSIGIPTIMLASGKDE